MARKHSAPGSSFRPVAFVIEHRMPEWLYAEYKRRAAKGDQYAKDALARENAFRRSTAK